MALPFWLCSAQSDFVSAEPPARIVVKAGEAGVSKIQFRLAPGYHTNSNTPSDEFLIPLRLTWEAAPLEVESVVYPKPHLEKYKFSEKPLSVFTGAFEISTRFKAAANAPKGPKTLTGKLRYQACSDNACYPPKTLLVKLPVEVR